MKPNRLQFSSYDGYPLSGTFQPASTESAALLFVHGITSSRDELGFHADFADYLADHGVSSLRFDYRFHGAYKSSLEELSLCGIVNDIDAAFSALVSEVQSTTTAFYVVGTSFGGGLAAYWTNLGRQKRVAKLLLNAPVINYENDVLERNGLVVNSQLTTKATAQLATNGFVTSSGIKFGRALINELRYVNGIAALAALGDRVAIFHGDADEDVPLSSSMQYKSPATTLKVIPGVGHGFGVENDEDLTFAETKLIHRSIYEESLRLIKGSV